MQNNDHFKFYTGYKNVLGQKCSFFHENLVNKKILNLVIRLFYKWSILVILFIGNIIYRCKILDISDKRLAEFNYKLLNNVLCNNVYLVNGRKKSIVNVKDARGMKIHSILFC